MKRIILVVLILGFIFLGCSDENKRDLCRDYTEAGVHPGETYIISTISKAERKGMCKYNAYIPNTLYASISFYDACDCGKWGVGNKLRIILAKE
jgi:hypothetical protein